MEKKDTVSSFQSEKISSSSESTEKPEISFTSKQPDEGKKVPKV